MATIAGDGFDNNLNDTPGDDMIDGGDGADIITVTNGRDSVAGGRGVSSVTSVGGDRLVVSYGNATAAVTFRTPLTREVGGDFGFNGEIWVGADLARSVSFTSIEKFSITTGSGEDVITLGGGANEASLGTGNDFLDAGTGTIVANGGEDANGLDQDGISIDFSVSDNGTDGVNFDLTASQITYGQSVQNRVSNFEYVGRLVTTSRPDTVVTLDIARDENILTLDGSDFITVLNGRDTVDAGAGFDSLIVDYSTSTSAIFMAAPTGSTPQGFTSYSGTAGNGSNRRVDFISVERFDIKTGSANDDITTGAGSDSINGGAGADRMAGGDGNDFYVVDNAGDIVVEVPTGGSTRFRPGSRSIRSRLPRTSKACAAPRRPVRSLQEMIPPIRSSVDRATTS